jgi:hypothetical protein
MFTTIQGEGPTAIKKALALSHSPLPSAFLSAPTCYRMISRGGILLPLPTNDAQKAIRQLSPLNSIPHLKHIIMLTVFTEYTRYSETKSVSTN